jgi:hypothetical protein
MARWLVEYADRYATPEGFYEELLEERRKESKKLPCPVCGWRNCGTYDLWLDQREHSLF